MSNIEPAHEELMVIDWVNSLDIPSCTLVDDLQDLKSGCVVADILGWLLDYSIDGVKRNIQTRIQAINNWSIILAEISEIEPSISVLRPEMILEVIFI